MALQGRLALARRAAWLACCWLLLLPDWTLVLVLAVDDDGLYGHPVLDVMYLKCDELPIDTTPVFNPMVAEYKATLDWKMEYFSVQARPITPAVVENVHLCPQGGDCQKQDLRIPTAELSRNIPVEPGKTVMYMVDVILQGTVRSYSINVHRLSGVETGIRHMIMQGGTFHPPFRTDIRTYRCFMAAEMEMALMEVHLQDGGQMVFASADAPVLLGEGDNITILKNENPGNTRSPPMRRRMREEAFGEFQYANKYIQFPVPPAARRLVNFKVVSADGGHFGYYSLELARASCGASSPLFDSTAGRCVRFCNVGYWADYEAKRCKQCPDLCASCLSHHRCVRCVRPDRQRRYMLDNVTGACLAVSLTVFEQHPQELVAAGLAAISIFVFLVGVCTWCCHKDQGEGLKAGAARRTRGAAGYTRVTDMDTELL